MPFYAYCLLRLNPDEPWPVMQGISEHPVFPLRCGKYTMLVSRLERNYPFTPRSIVEHGQVIARAFETHTVLPMRFATYFKSEKQIENLIQENQKELLEAFCRLRGKSEMRLKLLFQADSFESDRRPCASNQLSQPAGSPNGTSLDARNQEFAHRLAAQVGDLFHPLEQQISCRLVHSRDVIVDCAHLVESQKVVSYQKLQTAASEQVKNCDLRISGPWPPYHFLPTTVRLPAASMVPLRRRAIATVR
ncbi:MAG: GvpL/GvpF family gas vesicle protein [Acidobacteria bacterium]|nr:GvpL/GvpF family gas vesicle protein [Acidobacteriota bacterium]